MNSQRYAIIIYSVAALLVIAGAGLILTRATADTLIGGVLIMLGLVAAGTGVVLHLMKKADKR